MDNTNAAKRWLATPRALHFNLKVGNRRQFADFLTDDLGMTVRYQFFCKYLLVQSGCHRQCSKNTFRRQLECLLLPFLSRVLLCLILTFLYNKTVLKF